MRLLPAVAKPETQVTHAMRFSDQPFNGDRYILQEITVLAANWQVQTIIETGTHRGYTAATLAQIAPRVETIEIDARMYRRGRHLEQYANVNRHLGSSPNVLGRILPEVKRPVLFYLDAHFQKYWPLCDELTVIAKHGLSDSLLAIHDFLVPEQDFGYDTWNGQRLEFAFVEPLLRRIFAPSGFDHYFNEEAAGARRGIIYVTPRRRFRDLSNKDD